VAWAHFETEYLVSNLDSSCDMEIEVARSVLQLLEKAFFRLLLHHNVAKDGYCFRK
jgi:hypothetical protein